MGMDIAMKYYEALILFGTTIFQLPLLILWGCGLLDVWVTSIRQASRQEVRAELYSIKNKSIH